MRKIGIVGAMAALPMFLGSCGADDDAKDAQDGAVSEVLSMIASSDPCSVDTGALGDKWAELNTENRQLVAGVYDAEDFAGLVSRIDDLCASETQSTSTTVTSESYSEWSAAPEPTMPGSSAPAPSSQRLSSSYSEYDSGWDPDPAPAATPQVEQTPGPPAGDVGASREWRLMGPFQSTWTCQQNADQQPLRVSECFEMSDGAYYWNLVQAAR